MPLFSIFKHQIAIVLNSELKAACHRRADTEQPVRLMTLFNEVCLITLPWCWQGPFNPKQSCFEDENRNNVAAFSSMSNRSSDLSGRIKLAKFRLFIYSKLEPKIKVYGNLYISGKPRV